MEGMIAHRFSSLKQFWKRISLKRNRSVLCVNGQFFYCRKAPRGCPSRAKWMGRSSVMAWKEQFQGKKLMLEMWEDHADIRV